MCGVGRLVDARQGLVVEVGVEDDEVRGLRGRGGGGAARGGWSPPKTGVSSAVAKAVTSGWNRGWEAMPGGYKLVGEPLGAGRSDWQGGPLRQRGGAPPLPPSSATLGMRAAQRP